MSLFVNSPFQSHSGQSLPFKIECDNLSDEELDVFVNMIQNACKSYNSLKFSSVMGVPSGGTRIADKLQQYTDETANRLLIIDDVLTTGKSMEEYKAKAMCAGWNKENIYGIVLFSRADFCPYWVVPIYELNWRFL